MKKNYNSITGWLKKIFSLQTISLLIAVIAAYFTYKAYEISQPGQLTVEFPILNNDKDDITYVNAKSITRYFSLGFYSIPPVSINDGCMGGLDNMLLFPIISNQSDKSLKDFSVDIYIWHDKVMSSLFEQSKSDEYFYNLTNYNIISEDEYNTHLSYNNNFLAANRRLPNPINRFWLYLADKKISKIGGEVIFSYYITYDGAKEPVSFQYNVKMYYDEDWDVDCENKVSDQFISNSSYLYLKNTVFANSLNRRNFDDGEWVFIIGNNVYRNFKHLTSDEFIKMESHSYKNLQNE